MPRVFTIIKTLSSLATLCAILRRATSMPCVRAFPQPFCNHKAHCCWARIGSLSVGPGAKIVKDNVAILRHVLHQCPVCGHFHNLIAAIKLIVAEPKSVGADAKSVNNNKFFVFFGDTMCNSETCYINAQCAGISATIKLIVVEPESGRYRL